MGHPGHIPAHVSTALEITGDSRDYAVDYREVNARRNYSLRMILKRTRPLPDDVEHLGRIKACPEECLKGTAVRGWHDVSGFRTDVDLMIWALADNPEALQAIYRRVGALGTCHGQRALLESVWYAMSCHLSVEFNEPHLSACWGGFTLRRYMTVYPPVRSWDWYYPPATRCSAILKGYGLNGADYNDVAISTLVIFVLGDWEWTVTLEANKMGRVVGVSRKQHEVETHLFVRVDTPSYTGARVEPWERVNLQPTAPRDECVGLK